MKFRRKSRAKKIQEDDTKTKGRHGNDDETVSDPKPTTMRPAGTESKKNLQTLSLPTLPANLLGEVVEYLRGDVFDIARLKMVCKLLHRTMKSMKQYERIRAPMNIVLSAGYCYPEPPDHIQLNPTTPKNNHLKNPNYRVRESENYFSLIQYYKTYQDAFATVKVPPKIGVGATQVVLRGRHPYHIGMRFCLGLIPKEDGQAATWLECYYDFTHFSPVRLSVNLMDGEQQTLIRGNSSPYARRIIERYKKKHDNVDDSSSEEPWTIFHMVFDWENCTLNATMKTGVGNGTARTNKDKKVVTETYRRRYPGLHSDEFQCQGIQWVGIGGGEDVYDQHWSHIVVF